MIISASQINKTDVPKNDTILELVVDGELDKLKNVLSRDKNLVSIEYDLSMRPHYNKNIILVHNNISLLHLAVRYGYIDMVKYLLTVGDSECYIHKEDYDPIEEVVRSIYWPIHSTPLSIALKSTRDHKIAKLLIKNGAIDFGDCSPSFMKEYKKSHSLQITQGDIFQKKKRH